MLRHWVSIGPDMGISCIFLPQPLVERLVEVSGPAPFPGWCASVCCIFAVFSLELLTGFEECWKQQCTCTEVIFHVAFHSPTIHCSRNRNLFLRGELSLFCCWPGGHDLSAVWENFQAAATHSKRSTNTQQVAKVLICTLYMTSCWACRGQECIVFIVSFLTCLRIEVSAPQKPLLANLTLVELAPVILHFRETFRCVGANCWEQTRKLLFKIIVCSKGIYSKCSENILGSVGAWQTGKKNIHCNSFLLKRHSF